MTEHVGIFKRGDIWWYRIGRTIRRSSGSTNIEDALAIRALALASEKHRRFRSEWEGRLLRESEESTGWLRRTHASIRKRSQIKGWESYLTIEDPGLLLKQSNGFCAITGIPFVWRQRHPFSISVDRKDSRLGYVYGNVRLVLLAVNLGMSHWGMDALMMISRALVGRELTEASHTALHTAISAPAGTQ